MVCTKLAQRLARRRPFHSTLLLEDSRNSICKTLSQGGGVAGASRRTFNTTAYNPIHRATPIFNQTLGNRVSPRNWLLFGGVLSTNFNAARSIHSTASTSRDYYEVLGCSKNSTQKELKNAYYGLAKQLHPDRNKDDPDAEKKFQEVSKAYEVLKDEKMRAEYDQVGHDVFEQQSSPGGDPGYNPFNDIYKMNDFLKDYFRSKFHGNDVKISLELSFMEAVQGCTKNISFQTEVPCVTCGGQGVPPGEKPETCKRCKGSGREYIQGGMLGLGEICRNCGGTGKIVKNVCKSCKGNRVVRGTKSVKVDIMAGVDDDQNLKIYRSGGADPDGDHAGDLYVNIRVREDPVFRREGANIHVDAVLGITQAILGGTIQVPTLTGDVVLKVRPGTQPGQKVVLKKKGIKTRNSFTFGDQYVHFSVNIPSKLSQRQRELIEEFAKEENRGEDDNKRAAAGASR
ncbi:hypothetical protein ACFE04_002707 [Oxalis oulophora]